MHIASGKRPAGMEVAYPESMFLISISFSRQFWDSILRQTTNNALYIQNWNLSISAI